MTIEQNVVDLSPQRKPVQLSPGYHLMLTRLAAANHREIKGQLELMIEAEYQKTFPQPISDAEFIERR
jgi:hypothetical protein